MPKCRTVHPTPPKRVAPYHHHQHHHHQQQQQQHLRKPSTMATAVISPQSWQAMHHQPTHTPSLSWPQMQQYHQQPLLPDYTQQLTNPGGMGMAHAAQQPPPRETRQPSTSHSSQNDGGPWTAEMDNILIDAQARGMRWEQISTVYFPHKSANACRKRYGRAKEERRATDWDEARIGRVIAIYNREGFRERLWSQLANEAGERWQDIEKLCYSQGLSRMARGRGSHSRSRSRASISGAGGNVNGSSSDDFDQRYHSSNEEYDSRDDSGIGLGLGVITDQSHHHMPPSSQQQQHVVHQPNISSGAPIEMLIQPSHGYSYAS